MNQEKIWEFHQLKADHGESVFSGSLARYQHIAGMVDRGVRVLNIGVGRGDLERLLITKGCEVYSLDPSEGSILRMRESLRMGERAQVGYSQNIPHADRSFDVVIMSEVLEHLDDEVLAATLAEVRRTLDTGGRFVGSVPAEENLADSLCVCPCCGEQFHRWGHVQSFNSQSLRTLLSALFEVTLLSRHYFSNAADLNWKGRIVRRCKLALVALGRFGANETFVFESVRR